MKLLMRFWTPISTIFTLFIIPICCELTLKEWTEVDKIVRIKANFHSEALPAPLIISLSVLNNVGVIRGTISDDNNTLSGYFDLKQDVVFIHQTDDDSCIQRFITELDKEPTDAFESFYVVISRVVKAYYASIKVIQELSFERPKVFSKVRGMRVNVVKVLQNEVNCDATFKENETLPMRIILRYDPPDLDEDIIDLFHVQDMQFDANSNEQVRNELVESYANMNLACRMIGSRSSHQAVHLKMIQRFQAQVEFVDNTLGSESTFKLNFDLVNNIFTIEPTNSNTWKFYQRNDVLTYVRNSDGSCYVERGNFHRILCTESIVELFRWMNPMSDFEFVGVETYRGRLVEVYQKVSTTQNEQEKVNRLYQTTIYLVAHQNDDETRYELVMIHEEAMDSETKKLYTRRKANLFGFRELIAEDDLYRSAFDLSGCVDESVDSAQITIPLRITGLKNYESSTNRTWRLTEMTGHEIIRSIINYLDSTKKVPSYWIQNPQTFEQQGKVYFSFKMLISNGIQAWMTRLPFGSDLLPLFQTNPELMNQYIECASETIDSNQYAMSIDANGVCLKYTKEKWTQKSLKIDSDSVERMYMQNRRSVQTPYKSKYAYVAKLHQDFTIQMKPIRAGDLNVTLTGATIDAVETGETIAFPLFRPASTLRPSSVQRTLVNRQNGVIMLNRAQCERQCQLLASEQVSSIQTSLTKATDFACLSFSFCRQTGSQPAACYLSNRVLMNTAPDAMSSRLEANADCNVYHVNPLSQFDLSPKTIVRIEDVSMRLSREQHSSAESCALRCLSFGPICRTFTLLREKSNASTTLSCDFITLNAMHLTENPNRVGYTDRDSRAMVYTKKYLPDFAIVKERVQTKLKDIPFLTSLQKDGREYCALACSMRTDCEGFYYCSTGQSKRNEPNSFSQVRCLIETKSGSDYPMNSFRGQCAAYERHRAHPLTNDEKSKNVTFRDDWNPWTNVNTQISAPLVALRLPDDVQQDQTIDENSVQLIITFILILICFSIGNFVSIVVWKYKITLPRRYLNQLTGVQIMFKRNDTQLEINLIETDIEAKQPPS